MEPTADFETILAEPTHTEMSRETLRCYCLEQAIDAHRDVSGDKTDLVLKAAKEFEKYLKES